MFLSKQIFGNSNSSGRIAFLRRGSAWLDERKRLSSAALPYITAIFLVIVSSLILFAITSVAPINLVPIIYLIPVVICATRWGIWPALVAAIISALTADYFFFEPYYSFLIYDAQQVTDLALFLLVAFVCSNLADRMRREANLLSKREKEMTSLYDFSRRLAACFTVSDLISAITHFVSDTLGQDIAFIPAAQGEIAAVNGSLVPEEIRAEAASIMTSHAQKQITIKTKGQAWLLQSIASDAAIYGVLAINVSEEPAATAPLRSERTKRIMADALAVLNRIAVGRALDLAQDRLRADLLKEAFHGNISHELRTPLTSISGAAGVLKQIAVVENDSQASRLVSNIIEDANDLDYITHNLINASRLTSQEVSSKRQWIDIRDVVNAALLHRERRLARHRLTVTFSEDLPEIRADSVLLEQALSQLLDNAAKYSPADSSICVSAEAEASQVIISVKDQGIGLTAEEKAKIGRKSFRGLRCNSSISGSGLGFWIASAFVEANDGRIQVISNGQDKGTIVSILLPLYRQEPNLVDEAYL